MVEEMWVGRKEGVIFLEGERTASEWKGNTEANGGL